jgi:hypothetical protein
MDTVAVAIIEKMPAAYLMVWLPVLAAAGVWVFSHIRVDKQGKRYWYSRKYEDAKRNRKQDAIITELGKLAGGLEETKKAQTATAEDLKNIGACVNRQGATMSENRKDLLQLQICAVELPRTAKRIAYWDYKREGFNSWVDQYVVENGLFTKDEISYVHNNREEA